ncbi:MAG: L-threonylcarbamoyladenylate synthase, partial [Anaerovibrio sp.]|nr:L-threonylcarbamoyladenylate synthase [Anaerovibrio sp.]
SLQVANVNMIQQIAAYVPLMARKLLEKFAPGPITVVLPKSPQVPELVTGGRDTVGIRIPDNPVALAVLQAVGAPLAVPSANISGHVSPKSGADVFGDMAGRLAMILDGGPCAIGRESTIVDCTGSKPVIIRHGAISDEEIHSALEDAI